MLLAACGSSGGKKPSTTTNKAGSGGATGTKGAAAAKAHKRVGKVTAVGAGTITVAVKRLGTLQLHTTTATKIERAGTGTAAAIAAGDRVLVVHGNDVIVLPHDSKIGRLVTHVSKRSFTIAKRKGKKAATISLAKAAVIETTAPAAMSDLKTNSEVLVVVRGKGKGATDATEIILLPPGSPFAT
jgi:hypothetical protein